MIIIMVIRKFKKIQKKIAIKRKRKKNNIKITKTSKTRFFRQMIFSNNHPNKYIKNNKIKTMYSLQIIIKKMHRLKTITTKI